MPAATASFADAVGDYTAAGWPGLLPLPPAAKFPPPSGFTGPYGAWPDAAQLSEWAETRLDANLALRLQDGIIGIDVDAYGDKPGAATLADHEARLGALPATWTITSRDDGVSGIRLYRVPVGLAWPSWLGPTDGGVEIIRTGHRYAVAPHSIHPEGRPYRWIAATGEDADRIPAPDELAELPDAWVTGLTGGQAERSRATATNVAEWIAGLADDEPDEDVRRIVDGFVAFLASGASGSHREMLRVTRELAVAGATGAPGVPTALAEAEDAFLSTRLADGASTREATGEWDRGLAGAVGYLIENPVPVLEPFDVPADLVAAFDRIVSAGHHEKGSRRGERRPKPRLCERVLRRGDLARLPRPEPLIEDTIDRRTVALLAGYHGTYKSFVALSWAASVATGTEWNGRAARRGRVLYIVGEGAHGIDGRLAAWEEASGTAIADDDFHTLPVAVQLADPNALDEVIGYIEEVGFTLVVIDTVARAAVGLEENSSKDMGVFIDAADEIRRAMPDGTVLLVHHTGKDKTKVRGSSAIEAAMDTVYLTEGGDGLVDLKRTKRKDGPMADIHRLRFRQVGISGVLEPTTSPEDPSVSLDRLATAFHSLHRTFGHVGKFAGTAGVETLMAALGIAKSAARERLADLARDNILTVETVGRAYVYTLDPDAAIKRWGSAILHTGDKAENCQTPEAPAA
ncbi:UNVERIFIED_ORG: hypothetical protein E4P37_07940 [Bacillus sp. AZ43]